MLIRPKTISCDQAKDYVAFGDVSRNRLGKQCQYGSRFVDGRFPNEYPDLASDPKYGAPLRIVGEPGDYHDYRIHKDDVEELVKRYKDYYDAKDDADGSSTMLSTISVVDLRRLVK